MRGLFQNGLHGAAHDQSCASRWCLKLWKIDHAPSDIAALRVEASRVSLLTVQQERGTSWRGPGVCAIQQCQQVQQCYGLSLAQKLLGLWSFRCVDGPSSLRGIGRGRRSAHRPPPAGAKPLTGKKRSGCQVGRGASSGLTSVAGTGRADDKMSTFRAAGAFSCARASVRRATAAVRGCATTPCERA